MLKCRVCGMIINDKNFYLNNSGIPKENQLQDINYCPFCGASEEYLVPLDKSIIKVNSESLNKKTIKILDNAMKLEVFNSDFYKQASQLVLKKEVREMFLHLSNIEKIHAKIHQKMGGFKELPLLTKLDYTKYMGKGGDRDLIELAKKREIHAVEYYKKYKLEVDDSGVKEVFLALAKVETDHVNMEKKVL